MKHGGNNKRCGCVEDQQRIDSFEVKSRFFQLSGCRMLPHSFDGEVVTVKGFKIRVIYIQNAAGRLPFFLCPSCGQRVRFLYLPDWCCRKCSQLNYRSQQVTKGTFEAMAAIPKKLDVDPPADSWDIVDEYTLPRSPNMKTKRYEKYRRRFEKHQARYVYRGCRRFFSALGAGNAEIYEALINDTE